MKLERTKKTPTLTFAISERKFKSENRHRFRRLHCEGAPICSLPPSFLSSSPHSLKSIREVPKQAAAKMEPIAALAPIVIVRQPPLFRFPLQKVTTPPLHCALHLTKAANAEDDDAELDLNRENAIAPSTTIPSFVSSSSFYGRNTRRGCGTERVIRAKASTFARNSSTVRLKALRFLERGLVSVSSWSRRISAFYYMHGIPLPLSVFTSVH